MPSGPHLPPGAVRRPGPDRLRTRPGPARPRADPARTRHGPGAGRGGSAPDGPAPFIRST
ncbi:hypothetical protein GCM10010495_14930 [Kitasatospora herbaricolor]|nr:hypothetical protein GCM10010495_14930 [Kitasatospora herbaricolor]